MTPDDLPAAFVCLFVAAASTVLLTIAAGQVMDAIRDRPVVVRDLRTNRLTIVRSPNPRGRPRHHGRRD